MTDSTATTQVRHAKWALRAVFFFMGLAVAATAARVAEIKGHTGTSDAIWGYCMMLGNVGSMAGNLFGTRFARRFGTRRMVQLVMIVVGGSQIAYGFLDRAWQVPLVAFFAGGSYSLINIACNTQGSIIESIAGRSLMPSFHGSWSIGAFTGSFTAGLIAKHVSTATHLLFNSCVAIFGCIIFAKLLLSRSYDHADIRSNSEVAHDEPIPSHFMRFIWLAAIGSMLATIAETSVGDWSAILLHEDLHIPIGLNSLGYTCFVLAQITSRFSIGRLIDKHGIPRVIRFGGVIGGAGYLAGLLISYRIHHYSHNGALIVMCISYAILGFGVAPMPPSYVSVVGSIKGLPTSRGLTRLAIIAASGFLIGRFTISSLASAFGLQLALLFPACALIGSGILAFTLHHERISYPQ